MRRVLMLSWLFAPQASIGARRAVRFARRLPAAGWAPTVLCRANVPAAQRDASEESFPPEVTIERSYDHWIFPALQRAMRREGGGGAREAPLRGGLGERLGALWRRAVDAAVPMDTVMIHAPHAARRIDALAPGHAVIWSTSYPYHTHLLALRGARRAGLPFVADLRDPWSLNWVHRQKLAPTRRIERAAERAVILGADAVVVTTETLAERYRALFPSRASRIHALHNCFEPTAFAPRRARDLSAPLRVVHFGNVYGPWSLRTLFEAIARMRAAGALPTGVELINLGALSGRDRDLAAALGLREVVRALPPLSHRDGLLALRAADLLVLAAWDHPDASLFIQGKLYDYLLAETPFVAETRNPELADIVTRTGAGVVVAPGDVEAMRGALARALGGDSISLRPRNIDAISYFSAPQATARLAAIFDEVTR